MAYEVPSLSDILTDGNSEDSSNEDVDRNCETSDAVVKIVESATGSESKYSKMVLDLRNLNEINDFQNDDEKYEKLSEVIKEPEDLAEVAIILDQELTAVSFNQICEKSSALMERISLLNNAILSLREELRKEVSLWRKERDEFHTLQDKNDIVTLEEATAAARAAAEAYAAESPLYVDLDGLRHSCCSLTVAGEILDVNSEQTLSELTILEYEKRLAKYQDALAFAQAEKRYNMRRQVAANTYRQKLMEVERLCDEELERIKQNANSLQPLKQMVSQWYRTDRCGGDTTEDNLATPLDDTYKSASPISFKKDNSRSKFYSFSSIGSKIDAEINMAPGNFVGQCNNIDDTDLSFCTGINCRV